MLTWQSYSSACTIHGWLCFYFFFLILSLTWLCLSHLIFFLHDVSQCFFSSVLCVCVFIFFACQGQSIHLDFECDARSVYLNDNPDGSRLPAEPQLFICVRTVVSAFGGNIAAGTHSRGTSMPLWCSHLNCAIELSCCAHLSRYTNRYIQNEIRILIIPDWIVTF